VQKCVGFFFVWRFVVLEAKATSVWAPASAGVTSSGAILANVHTRARSSVIVRLVIWVPQGVLRETPCRNAWGFFSSSRRRGAMPLWISVNVHSRRHGSSPSRGETPCRNVRGFFCPREGEGLCYFGSVLSVRGFYGPRPSWMTYWRTLVFSFRPGDLAGQLPDNMMASRYSNVGACHGSVSTKAANSMAVVCGPRSMWSCVTSIILLCGSSTRVRAGHGWERSRRQSHPSVKAAGGTLMNSV
jgi:hypothetical protein